MDDIDRIGDLEEIGGRFAAGVDWDALRAGYVTPSRARTPKCPGDGPENTLRRLCPAVTPVAAGARCCASEGTLK